MKKIFPFLISLVILSCNEQDADNPEAILKNTPFKNTTDSIKKFPKADTLYFQRGLLLSDNKKYELAFIDFKKAFELKETENNGISVGITLMNLNKKQEAADLFYQLSQKFPENLIIRQNLASAYEETNNLIEAEKQYDFILKKIPDAFEIMATKAAILEETNRIPEAISLYQKVYDSLPSKMIGERLAFLYAETKNPKTVSFCDNLIKADTGDLKSADPHYYKATYYYNVGNKKMAMQTLDETIKVNPQYEYAFIDKGIILQEEKNYTDALKSLKIAQNLNPSNPEILYQMGKCYEALKNTNEAIYHYESALALDRNFEYAKEALAKLKK